MNAIATFLIKQWRATRVLRAMLIAFALAGLVWVTRATLHEWQVMRIVNIMTEQLEHATKNQPHYPSMPEETRG